MTKAEIVSEISAKTGLDKVQVMAVVESFMDEVRIALTSNENVNLRGFGSFVVKQRAEKVARNISKNVTITIPAHSIPSFKPAKTFMESVKNKK